MNSGTMSRAVIGRVVGGSEVGEQDHNDDDSPSPNVAGTPTARGQTKGGNCPRKRRPQDQLSASELRYPRRRSSKACRLCRARKTKCDNVHPTCGFCSTIGTTCTYDDGPSDHSSFDPASLEILRTLGQLVDSQKDLLEVIRVSNHQTRQQHDATLPDTTTQPHTTHHGRQAHPWAEEVNSLRSSGYNNSVLESTNPERNSVSRDRPNNVYSIGASFQGRQDAQPTFAETSFDATKAGNPAALYYFDLLTNYGGGEDLQPDECEAQRNRDLLDDGTFVGTPLQRATRIVDDSLDTRGGTSNYSISAVDDIGLPVLMLERQRWQDKDVIQLLPGEKILFRNFVQRTSFWIDLFDPRSHFCAIVPRLALHNAGLMNAILALSCHHLSLSRDINSPETTYKNDALQYHYQTLHYVQKAMRHSSYQDSSELIATTLIISTYEMLAGSQKDWERHLRGVFYILKSQNINVEIEALESAVWWAWLRQDIWAAFREKRTTYTAWTPKKTFGNMNPHEMASRSVWHLAQVINFCAPDINPTDHNRLRERQDRVEQLLLMLNEWRQCLPIEFYPLPGTTENSSSAFRPLLIYPQCYGLAIQTHYVSRILLSFHELSFGGIDVYSDRMRSIESWIHIVCGVGMTLTDDASSILSSQCMFIAGMFAQDRRERQCVLELLADCRNRTGWPADPLEDELKQIWHAAQSKSASSSVV